MDPTGYPSIKSLEDTKLFIAARSVSEKKPFKVLKSDPSRFDVVCIEKFCSFKVNVAADHEGLFFISKECPHSCSSNEPTIKKAWVCWIMTEVLSDFPSIQTRELERYFKLTYKVDVPQQMIVKAKCALKKSTQERAESFGKIKSFLCNFVEANAGSTASVSVKEGEFQRAFLFLKHVRMRFATPHESLRWMAVT